MFGIFLPKFRRRGVFAHEKHYLPYMFGIGNDFFCFFDIGQDKKQSK